ncbi:4-alpha-glucanotransferase DPE2-like [Zingiber officinale]|uniref:4-alpha-glucanotransferase DPE2-like n=1 Tax=Zingiber officinale TaxID=94328 RepID=UPI001C4DC8F9|nr:4-alpha-glucanotransferase DPE2-like [Zingiber officinale]
MLLNLGSHSGIKSRSTVTLVFRLPYYTQWGQSLLICGSQPPLGSGNVKQGLALSPSHQGDELIWYAKVSVSAGFSCEYSYYVVDDNRNVLRREAGKKRRFTLPSDVPEKAVVEIRDLWQEASESLFLSSAFKDVIFGGEKDLDTDEEGPDVSLKSLDWQDSIVVQFMIRCSKIEHGASIGVTGSASQLGKWKTQDGLRLKYAGDNTWKAECVLRKYEFPLKYKYYQVHELTDPTLELGPNRELSVDSQSIHPPNYIVLADGPFRVTAWRGSGVAIPMFSIRSTDDLGVGEFLDLKLLVDWAVESGFHLVQLLPINDTSVHRMWWDSYPYSSLSVFALHPLYLRVQALSDDIPENIKEEILKMKQQLDKKDVDYEATMAAKLSISKKIFDLEKEKILNSGSFKTFISENENWLKPYAAYCFLRDFFETSDRTQWGSFSHFSSEKLEKLVSEDALHHDVIFFHYYIQFHLHKQLSEAADYARKKKIVLKGDLPIGVDRNSVDTWVYPNLFRMNTSTGAPPDYFDKNGQNWGFPTYNWEEMSKDNYAWWRARLTQMAKYFTAYRIDHILGFFRIWELPDHAATGLVGKFRPSIALSQEELEKEGIWDFNRLSCPYVRQEILQEKFGTFWTVIASNFFNEYQKLCYEFKEDCNTEKNIISKLKTLPEKSLWLEKESKIQSDLLELIQNIVLIRDPEDPRKFYPRFNLEDTSNFKALDEHSKNVLKRLYYDYYFCRQEDLWRQNAMKTLPVLLNSSDMLACGEDLGLIPSCVHPVMQELGLIGLRIQRMPNEPDREFGIPSQYPYMTVCAPSCHDCSTMRAWWEEDEERRCRFYRDVVGCNDIPPPRCTPDIAYYIIQQHIQAPSMWAIFPLQDMLALKDEYTTRPAVEETINDPTNPKHYWRYRLHITLDSLLLDNDLKNLVKDMVINSGRSYPVEKNNGIGVAAASEKKQAEKVQEGIATIQINGSSSNRSSIPV